MKLSKFKLKLYKTLPNLFMSDIREMAQEYDKEKTFSYTFEEGKELTLLEQILPYVASDKFFDVLYNNARCRLNFSSLYTPKALRENSKIIDLAIKYYPLTALEVSNDLLTDEHLIHLENYLRTSEFKNLYIPHVPPKFAKSDILFQLYLDYTFREKTFPAKDKDIFIIFLTYINYPEKIRVIIEKVKLHHQKHGILANEYDEYGFDVIWTNPDILNYYLNLDNRYISYMNENTKEDILRIVANKILSGTFNVEQSFEKYINKIKDSNIILDAIFKTNDLTRYQKIISQCESTSLNYIQMMKLFEYNKLNDTEIVPLNWGVNPNYLHVFISNPDLRYKNIKISDFNPNSLDDSVAKYIIDNIDTFPLSEIIEYVGFANKNTRLIKGFIKHLYENAELFIIEKQYDPFVLIQKNDELTEEDFDYIVGTFYKIDQVDKNRMLGTIPWLFENETFVKKIVAYPSLCKYKGRINVDLFLQPDIINEIFKNTDKTEFFNDNNVKSNFKHIYNVIEINSLEEYKELFSILRNKYDISLALFLISRYKRSGFEDPTLDDLTNAYIEYTKNDLYSKFPEDKEKVDMFVDAVVEGKRNPFTVNYIKTNAQLTIAAHYSDILENQLQEMINDEHNYIYDNINKKHLKEIIILLENIGFESSELFEIAINMYASIGYNRSKDMLNPNPNKNYGEIDKSKLKTLFSGINIAAIPLVKEGKNYAFQENKFLVNLLMGSNYKDKSTIIHHYLNDFKEKELERDKKIEAINNKLNLTEEEKKSEISKITEEYENYKKDANTFITRFRRIFNNWDIIEEEFLKAQAKSKIKLKLNMSYLNSISVDIKEKRTKPKLEPRDILLEQSDVFEYVGYDTQYTTNPEKAPNRAIELSRRMDNVKTKKFPNIKIEKDGYQLFIYEPHDRRILSAGYRSGCCFRPNGNADNNGNDNSLLNYCAATEYGGGVEVKNTAGETIMFSPLLRSGNVLMIHSIETKHSDNQQAMKIVHELLSEFGQRTIEEAIKHGDSIDFVTITDLHHLQKQYTKGAIPQESKFNIFDENQTFSDMYTNLDSNQMILEHAPGKTINDISYGSVEVSYEYPIIDYYFINQFSNEERELIEVMSELEEKIIDLSNKRFIAKKNSQYELSNVLLLEIKQAKNEYLKYYKKALELRKGIDIFNKYKESSKMVAGINEQLGVEFQIDIKELYNGVDWYIIITPENKVIPAATPSGEQRLREEIEKLETLRGTLDIITIEELKQNKSL